MFPSFDTEDPWPVRLIDTVAGISSKDLFARILMLLVSIVAI
jgi:hypothetical protein